MGSYFIVFVYFFYGLAFFSMGLVLLLEGGRASDPRLRRALQPLTVFGLLHGGHEWMEMFHRLRLLPGQAEGELVWMAGRLLALVLSFLALSTFGVGLLAPNAEQRRLSQLVPLVQVLVWGLGLLRMRAWLPPELTLGAAGTAWTRYTLAIPAALLAAAGLVVQQRIFRWQGLIGFGRDSLWAAVAFAWYGLIGQLFTAASPLPPSDVLNEELFQSMFGVPIQLPRAIAAAAAALFVIRFLRAFEVETQRQIAELQAARLGEAERREALRGELLRRVVAAQEAERQRIARDLHDATGQSLTALGLGLRGASTSVTVEPDRAVRELRQLETLTAGTLEELRHLISDLRPPHLDDLGLAATLRWYAKQVKARTGLEVLVEINGEQRPLPAPLKLALFRIAQEALNNVVKHSGARQAVLRLDDGPDRVVLRVEDNGHGFDLVQATGERPSWGLVGMQERATLLGGHVSIASAPEQGTRVRVEIPFREMETAE